ncbi:MAG: sigma-70 family RNA polymerase sigma factor [Verrucomicrobiota bacterium]
MSKSGASSRSQIQSQHSWEDWLATHGEVFFLYARQNTRSTSDAMDVFQEALTESWRKSGGTTPDRKLVFATIRRRSVDLARSIDRRSKREQRFVAERQDWFVPDYAAGDTREHLATAIRELPENLREVVVLRIWGELTFPAIAEITGVSVATATSRYRYALERLRECATLTELVG